MITNPYRNGILTMVDNLMTELNVGELESKIMRARLKSALKEATEIQAEYYLRKVHYVIGEIICITQK